MGLMKLDRRTTAESQIKHLNHHREGHGEIDVSLGYVHIKTVADQRHADQEQKAERQHLDGRMFLYEGADFAGKEHHEADRNDYRGNHDGKLAGHSQGGDDRIKGKNDVQQENLHNNRAKGCSDTGG